MVKNYAATRGLFIGVTRVIQQGKTENPRAGSNVLCSVHVGYISSKDLKIAKIYTIIYPVHKPLSNSCLHLSGF